MSQQTILSLLQPLATIQLAVGVATLLALMAVSWRKKYSDAHILKAGPFILWLEQFLFLVFGVGLLWMYLRGTDHPELYLPPHGEYLLRHIAYLITTFLSSVIAAAALFWVCWYIFIRRAKGVFLDHTDVMLLIIGAAAVGWPAVLVFLAVTFLISVLGMLTLILFKRKTVHDRLVITAYIIPAAILTLIFRTPLLEITHLIKIRF